MEDKRPVSSSTRQRRPNRNSGSSGRFYSLSAPERVYLLLLILGITFVFLPWTRNYEVGGMVLFGWLMAALMVFSPLLVLFLFSRDDE